VTQGIHHYCKKKKKSTHKTGYLAQAVEYLLNKSKALSSNLSLTKKIKEHIEKTKRVFEL
jgi:hypothetical protein